MTNPTHFAVVAGINIYPAIRNLNSAKGDAEKFHEWLVDPTKGALEPDNAILITEADEDVSDERKEAKPTAQLVYEALDELQTRCEEYIEENPASWEETRLYVYVSGHGIAPGAREAALLMADAGPPRYYSNNFSCDKHLKYFETSQTFHELVFLADCCREFVGVAQTMGPPWDEVKGHNGKVISLPGYATYFGEFAFEPVVDDEENPDEQRSYFTKALLEGLNGQAARNGTVDSNSLSDYVVTRVQELTKNKRKPQQPQMIAEPGAPIIFRDNISAADAKHEKTHTVKITFPQDYNGTALLQNANFREIGQHDSSKGEWHLELSNSLYLVEDIGGNFQFANKGMFKIQGEDCDVQL